MNRSANSTPLIGLRRSALKKHSGQIPAKKVAVRPSFCLKGLVDEMIATAGIDTSRIYICGLSMGGYGTWDLTARYENFFAAAAPICGGGNPENGAKLAKLPIWCFHGGKDNVVPPSDPER